MDPRSGLSRFHGFRIPHFEMMMSLIDYCRNYKIEDILMLPDIKERADFLFDQQERFKEQLKRCATVHDKLIVIDLLGEKTLFAGNRFMIYALFPHCNISMSKVWGRDKKKIICGLGKSIFDRSSSAKVGDLMLAYGGGGHRAAGTCQIDPKNIELVQHQLISQINTAN